MHRRLWALQVRLTLIVLLLLIVAQGALGVGTGFINAWSVAQRALGRPVGADESWIATTAGSWGEGAAVLGLSGLVAWGVRSLFRRWRLL